MCNVEHMFVIVNNDHNDIAWYLTIASEQQKQCTKDILRSLPTFIEKGIMKIFFWYHGPNIFG